MLDFGVIDVDYVDVLLVVNVQVGQSSLHVDSYIERESHQVHDTVLTKLCNSFFASLPDTNPLPSNASPRWENKPSLLALMSTANITYLSNITQDGKSILMLR